MQKRRADAREVFNLNTKTYKPWQWVSFAVIGAGLILLAILLFPFKRVAHMLGRLLCRAGFHQDPGLILGKRGWGYTSGPCKRCQKHVTVWDWSS